METEAFGFTLRANTSEGQKDLLSVFLSFNMSAKPIERTPKITLLRGWHAMRNYGIPLRGTKVRCRKRRWQRSDLQTLPKSSPRVSLDLDYAENMSPELLATNARLLTVHNFVCYGGRLSCPAQFWSTYRAG